MEEAGQSGAGAAFRVVMDKGDDAVERSGASECRPRVVNPGFDRTTSPFEPMAPSFYRTSVPDEVVSLDGRVLALEKRLSAVEGSDPWLELLFWETPHDVECGLHYLLTQPYYYSRKNSGDVAVPTRLWFPHALNPNTEPGVLKLKCARDLIAALVRQAREYYRAATAGDVTDLSRPVLYFYGAEALAEALGVSLFGPGLGQDQKHGLTTGKGRVPREVVLWMERGVFPRFYQAVRTDIAYNKSPQFTGNVQRSSPKVCVHVDDCLAALGLRPTDFAPNVVPLASGSDSDDPGVVMAPPIVWQYIALYYFSIMARYHTLEWQALLGGDGPRTLPIRKALAVLPHGFVREVLQYLPRTPGLYPLPPLQGHLTWTASYGLGEWKPPTPTALLATPVAMRYQFGPFEEWDGAAPPSDR